MSLPQAEHGKPPTCRSVSALRCTAADIAARVPRLLAAAERVAAFVCRIDAWRADHKLARHSAATEIAKADDALAHRFAQECDTHIDHLLAGTLLGDVLRAWRPATADVELVLEHAGESAADPGMWSLLALLHTVPLTGGAPAALDQFLAAVRPEAGPANYAVWCSALRKLARALEREPSVAALK